MAPGERPAPPPSRWLSSAATAPTSRRSPTSRSVGTCLQGALALITLVCCVLDTHLLLHLPLPCRRCSDADGNVKLWDTNTRRSLLTARCGQDTWLHARASSLTAPGLRPGRTPLPVACSAWALRAAQTTTC